MARRRSISLFRPSRYLRSTMLWGCRRESLLTLLLPPAPVDLDVVLVGTVEDDAGGEVGVGRWRRGRPRFRLGREVVDGGFVGLWGTEGVDGCEACAIGEDCVRRTGGFEGGCSIDWGGEVCDLVIWRLLRREGGMFGDGMGWVLFVLVLFVEWCRIWERVGRCWCWCWRFGERKAGDAILAGEKDECDMNLFGATL